MNGGILRTFGWIACAAAACIVTVVSGQPIWLVVAVFSIGQAGAHLVLGGGARVKREREQAERLQSVVDALDGEIPFEAAVLTRGHRACELHGVRHGGPQLAASLELTAAASEQLLRGICALAEAELTEPSSVERARTRAGLQAFGTLVMAGLVTAAGPAHVAWLAGVSVLGLGLWASTAAIDGYEQLRRGVADWQAVDQHAAALAGGAPWIAEALLAIEGWEDGYWIRCSARDRTLIRFLRPLEPPSQGKERARALLGLPSDQSSQRALVDELREYDPLPGEETPGIPFERAARLAI